MRIYVVLSEKVCLGLSFSLRNILCFRDSKLSGYLFDLNNGSNTCGL